VIFASEQKSMSNVEQLSQNLLRSLLSDFSDRRLTAKNLCDGYLGLDIPSLVATHSTAAAASPVDFELALKELEDGELVDTGPIAAYDNPPNSGVLVIGIYSKREYVYLTEKGYKAAQKALEKRVSTPAAPRLHISGGHFHQSPIGVGTHITQSITASVSNAPVFSALRAAIDDANLDGSQRTQLLERIGSMEAAPDQHTFIERYQSFMALAADHVTIVAPFLPALAVLLTGQFN
jgi:hypothetical protein